MSSRIGDMILNYRNSLKEVSVCNSCFNERSLQRPVTRRLVRLWADVVEMESLGVSPNTDEYSLSCRACEQELRLTVLVQPTPGRRLPRPAWLKSLIHYDRFCPLDDGLLVSWRDPSPVVLNHLATRFRRVLSKQRYRTQIIFDARWQEPIKQEPVDE